ncbi:MAG: prolyl-tRNA synthetase associated domain-containing protein [Alphaproteobacteria bacterium]|nr:prolyl-tRNA synthetase associated domain-containing protein [Alphaproteobacteria bacterium]
MDDARRRLFRHFESLGIDAPTVPYPAHKTVAEGKAQRGAMKGQFTKNLLLKDKKGRLYLVVVHEDRTVDLRTLHTRLGANGRLGFASADQMRAALGIEPGALTPLALLNDGAGAVTVVIDAVLMGSEQINFHPLINTESTGIAPRDLLAFIASCGREPAIVNFGGGGEESVRQDRSPSKG